MTGVEGYGLIDERGLAFADRLEDSFRFDGGVKAVVFAVEGLLSPGALPSAAVVVFIHNLDYICTSQAKIGQGTNLSDSLTSDSYFEYSISILKNQTLIETLTFILKNLGLFFLLPFKRFGFLFCNRNCLSITGTKIVKYFDLAKLIQVYCAYFQYFLQIIITLTAMEKTDYMIIVAVHFDRYGQRSINVSTQPEGAVSPEEIREVISTLETIQN